METKNKIYVYATSDGGEGRVMLIGKYDSVEEIDNIIISLFARDVVISFELEKENPD